MTSMDLPAIDLKGRVAVVTGSSQNLGKVMAIGLARAGAKVVLASPEMDRLTAVAEEIGQELGKGKAIAVECDITKESDCKRVLDESIRAFGGVDVLVNNARNPRVGLTDYKSAPFWERPVAFWEAAVRVNVFGTYLMTRTIVPHMIQRKWGRIVNISTGLGSIQEKHNSPYGVTKVAIDVETIIWAQDLEGTGVTVNTLLPGGACETERPREKPVAPGQLLSVEVMVPPVIWLASDLSASHSGGRYIGCKWDNSLKPNEAAQGCLEPPLFRPMNEDD
jgi:NAD(P)-dependent dehydrogenase (short-subunit alcohol dehydrogenase family)